MAIKPTIVKAKLQLSDMDRGVYGDFGLTLAQHPSETDERTMVRILAFALNASESLSFTEGIAAEDEPDLWQKSLSGEIELWIDVGLPDERRIRKACNRAKRVIVYAYGGRAVAPWWAPIEGDLKRHKNLTVVALPFAATKELEKIAQKTMDLHCTVQDGQMYLGDAAASVFIAPETLYGGG